MTDNLRAWLNERETIHGAVPGKTWANYGSPPFEVYDSTEYDDGDMGEVLAETRWLELSHAIVDAHNTLPKLLAGVRAVLELHKPNISKFRVSVWCASECRDSEGNIQQYPCSTVKKLQEAINDE